MSSKNKGFTLVELMVTIAVAAILLAIGVPSLTSIYESIRVNNNIEKINNVLAFARNQAISYGATVRVCTFKTATTCDTGANWRNGIRVYIKDASNVDHELRAIDAFKSSDKVKGPTAAMTFSPEGLSSGGTFVYCAGSSTPSKSVIVSSSGLISYGTDGQACL